MSTTPTISTEHALLATNSEEVTTLPTVTSKSSMSGSTGKKELALERAGATREAAYSVMVKGLTSKRMTVDKFGDEHWEEDTTNQLKASELISRLNGDLRTDVVVDNRTVNISGVDSSVVSSLLAMVMDVKAQLDLLASSGKQTGEIIDVIATSG